MHIVRTIIWVLLLAALLIFSIANWDPTVTVRIWPGLLLDTKIPAIVILSLLAGFVPMWLYLRAEKWRLKRRIHNLENAARTANFDRLADSFAGLGPRAETLITEIRQENWCDAVRAGGLATSGIALG